MISPSDAATPAVSRAPSPELLRKYAGPAPRYTSYPPATVFTEQTAPLRLEEALVADNQDARRPLSLYVHLPFCESRCWYCGCTTVITRQNRMADEYLDDLERELAVYDRYLNPRRPVVQLHLGGGTPTFLSAAQLARLRGMLFRRFTMAKDAEISVEIDPRRLVEEQVAELQSWGINRASLGVQDTTRAVQLAIHRFQPNELNVRAFNWLRGIGIGSINVDLIYGLPLQTRQSFGQTLDDVLQLGPDRLSVFSYAHVPWLKPAQRIFEEKGQLPDDEEKLAMFLLAHERLTGAGLVDIGLDHFARPDDELAVALREGTLHRNFQGYTTRAGASLYGFGLSSIGQTESTYHQNSKDLIAYRAAVRVGALPFERGYRLSLEDQRRRAVVMGIMCQRRVDFSAWSEEWGVDFRAHFAAELASLAELERDGILKLDTKGLQVLPAGVPLLRVVAMRFDGASPAARAGRHARAI